MYILIVRVIYTNLEFPLNNSLNINFQNNPFLKGTKRKMSTPNPIDIIFKVKTKVFKIKKVVESCK